MKKLTILLGLFIVFSCEDIDETPPVTMITNIQANAELTGIVKVIVDATDDDEVARVEFFVNGVLSATSEVNDHRDHKDWRGQINVESPNLGYFRWGDEEKNDRSIEDRFITLNNISDLIEVQPTTFEGYLSVLDNGIEDSMVLSNEERLARLSIADKKPKSIVVQTTNYRRNPDVIVEVLSRANGICENCDKPAPFIRRRDGTPYLEVHHIIQLSKGGNDTINNAVAICPNCHRELHFG
jgi:5-methylcytosine-specific restriction protein A